MQPHEIILELIGDSNLVGFAASNFSHGKSDRKTHYGFVQFFVSNQPKLRKKVLVRIELTLHDTYTVCIFKDLKIVEAYIEKVGVKCDDLLPVLFEIFGERIKNDNSI